MPLVTVSSVPRLYPNGYPSAITSSPTRTSSEFPRLNDVKSPVVSIWTTARSATASLPRTTPLYELPSDNTKETVAKPPTTCALVTTKPSSSMMKPLPLLPSGVYMYTRLDCTTSIISASVGVGAADGVLVGCGAGAIVGAGVGAADTAVGVGVLVGCGVGAIVGAGVGAADTAVGIGVLVGCGTGVVVGTGVGAGAVARTDGGTAGVEIGVSERDSG